ncbi:hypothetical protein WJX77_002502 [Trebouxia sp. C0004]
MVAGRLILTVQHATNLQPLLGIQTENTLLNIKFGKCEPTQAAKLICKCRIGHDHQWTNSKAAGTSGPDVETLAAAWDCALSFDVHGNPAALHLGVYAAQPHQAHDVVNRSSSFLSVVSRSLSSLSIKSPVPSVLQRLSSRTLRGLPSINVQDSDVPLRELALQTPPDMLTPFTQRLQNTQEVNLAAAYSENPTPCHSSRGSCTISSSSSTRSFRGNKENKGGGSRSKAKSEAKSRQSQTFTLLGGVRIPLEELLQQPKRELAFPLYDRTKQEAGMIQVKCEFVPILREGWLQYRSESRSMMKGWKVGWFELLADGKLSWFPSPSKQPHESRGQIHVTCIEAMGLATAFKNTVNGRSHLEVHHRVVGSKVSHILSLKANHPDDAASWLRDMQLGRKVLCKT